MTQITLLADENFNLHIIDGLRARVPEVDVLLARDAGLLRTPDELILAWAAERQRVVLTHDETTMVPAAHERVGQYLPMPGLIVAPWGSREGPVIESLVFILGAGNLADLRDVVLRVPLR